MKPFLEKNKVALEQILILLLAIVGAYIFFQYLFPFIAPFVIGWLLSLLFSPFVTFLEKKAKIPRWIGSLLAILLLLAFFSSIVVGLWKKLFSEAVLFYDNLPAYISSLQQSVEKVSGTIDGMLERLPIDIKGGISLDALGAVLPSLVQTGSSQSFHIISGIPAIFMIILIALISSYFFTKDKAAIAAFSHKHFHTLFEGRLAEAKNHLKYSILGYVKTQLILMCYTFVICLVGLFLLRSPYALLLSVVTSIIDALPFFGSGFILWPGALIYLLMGKPMMALGYIVIYLCVNFMRQIMQPKILGTQIGLHPLLILIAMYIGFKCLGFLGMIIGPILAVLLKAIYQEGERVREEVSQKNTNI